MSEIGEIKAKITSEAELSGIDRAANSLEKLVGHFENVRTAGEKTDQALKTNAIGDTLNRQAASLSNIAGKLNAWGNEISRSAGAADDLGDSLRGAFGDRADAMSGTVQKLGTELGLFSDQVVAGASKQLEKFGVATEQNLSRVVDIAAKTGQSVEGLGTALGKFEKFGDGKSTLALQKTLGITGQEMAAFGAKVDSSNKVLADTPARAAAAQQAMQAIIDTKFGGAAAAMADDTTHLAGEIEMLKRELGEAAHGFKEGLAPGAREAVAAFRGLSPEVKGAVGMIVEFGGMGASAAASALTMGAQIAILSQTTAAQTVATNALRLATLSLSLGFGAAVIAVAAVAAGVTAYIATLDAANKAAEDLLTTEEKRSRGLHDNKNLIGMSAKDAKRLGKTSADASGLVQGLQEEAEKAGKVGSPERTAVEKKIQAAQHLKQELAKLEAADKQKAPPKAPNDESDKERKKREAEEAKAQKKREADQKKADKVAEDGRKSALKDEISGVAQSLNAHKISKAQAIEQYRQIATQSAKTADERRGLEEKIAALTGQLETERKTATTKAETEREKATKKAEAERTKHQKDEERKRLKSEKDQAREVEKTHKDSLKAQATATKEHHQEEVRQTKAAAAAKQQTGVTLSPFLGGPIQGTIEDRQQRTSDVDAAKRDAGMASNKAEQDRMIARGGTMGARATLGKRAQEWIAARSEGDHKRATDWIEASKWGDQAALSRHIGLSSPGLSKDPAKLAAVAQNHALKPGEDLKTTVAAAVSTAVNSVGKEVTKGLGDSQIVINVNYNGQQAGSFHGTASELSRSKNVVNHNQPLGRS